MRRRVPLITQAAALIVCAFLIVPAPGAGEALPRGVSDQVFHITAYDEYSRPVHHGQGIIVGPRGVAIVSVSTLESAVSAEAVMMDGSTVPILGVLAEDSITGLAKVRLQRGISAFLEQPVESGYPKTGGQLLYSALTRHSGQACIVSIVTSVKKVPDQEDLYYVEASQPLPGPGGAVFSPDGRMLGIVLMHSGDPRKGILVSEGRIPFLGVRQTGEVALDKWTSRRKTRWQEKTFARYLMGQVALWEGRPLETLDHIEDHVRALPEIGMSMTALLGEAYLALDYLPEAIHAFKAAIDLGSPPARVYRKLAWTYMESGQYSSSESMCRKAILMDSGCSSGYTLMAHLRNLQGQYKQAIYEARRALLRKPDCPCAHFERGRGYLGLARYGAAIDSLQTATTLDPTYSVAFDSLGYARMRSGRIPGAISALEEAVRLEPEMAAAWRNLGDAYSMANMPEKAIYALRLAVCLDPSRGNGYCRLARELIDQGRYLDAVDIIREGLDRCEGSQWLVYYLGKALLYEGHSDLARDQAERLCRENKKLADQLVRLIDDGSDG